MMVSGPLLTTHQSQIESCHNEHMQALEKAPDRVKKYFPAARVKYAA
jgi:hypothetical protein